MVSDNPRWQTPERKQTLPLCFQLVATGAQHIRQLQNRLQTIVREERSHWTHTNITRYQISFSQHSETFFFSNLNMLTVTSVPHPWSLKPLSGMRALRANVQTTDLCNCFNESHMPVILIISLLESHGTVRSQYTECSLTHKSQDWT